MVKHSRKHRKGRKGRKGRSHRRSHRRYRGGVAPVDYSNPGPMNLNLAQGQQYASFHANQHGGVFSGGPYPGAVTEPSMLPSGLVASSHLLPLNQAFDQIRGLRDDNQAGGRRHRGRKGSRKHRKGSRKTHKGRKNRSRRYRGGDFVRWGGGGMPEMLPSSVADSTKMLISPQLQQQAGLNPEWKLAENPAAFDPLPQ